MEAIKNTESERVEPAIGIQSTCEPEEKLTLREWYEYIGKLIIADREKPKE